MESIETTSLKTAVYLADNPKPVCRGTEALWYDHILDITDDIQICGKAKALRAIADEIYRELARTEALKKQGRKQ